MTIGIVATDGVVGAGVTTVLVLCVLLTTLLVSVLDLGTTLQLDFSRILGEWQVFRLLPISQLFVLTSRELLLSIVLLHWFRGLERVYGTARFLALLAFAVFMFPLIVSVFAVLAGVALTARPGPFAPIYAAVVIFWCDTPPTFSIGGKRWAWLRVSDKWFVYAVALQLALAVPSRDSLVSALAGLCCGMLYRSPYVRVNRAVLRPPRWLLNRAEFTRRAYEPPVFRLAAWQRRFASGGASLDFFLTGTNNAAELAQQRRANQAQQAQVNQFLRSLRQQAMSPAGAAAAAGVAAGAHSVLPLRAPPRRPATASAAAAAAASSVPRTSSSAAHAPSMLAAAAASAPVPLAVTRLVEMGFAEPQVLIALSISNGDVDAALDWLVSQR